MRALRVTRQMLFAVSVCAVVPACNWTTFADDANTAPVRGIGAPEGFKSQDFGSSLLPLSDGQGKAAAFVASGINGSNLAIVSIDSGGGVSSVMVPNTALQDADGAAITSLVEVPGTSPPKLLLAAPKLRLTSYGRVYSYLLSPMLDGVASMLMVPALATEEPGLGRGLAVARLAGVEATSDFVIASDDGLTVMVDGIPANSTQPLIGSACDVAFDASQDQRYLVRRPLLAARLWTDQPGTGEQLVSGSTHAVAAGKVSFFSVTGAAPAFALNCIGAVSAPAGKARFGRSLAVGDFNGDKVTDLLVGAPGQDAFIYLGPFLPGVVPANPIAINDSSGVDFGYAVAAMNLDGNAGDEAVIADPRATVDGNDEAGRVRAYKWDAATMTMVLYKTYSDHSPVANAKYGSTVAGLNFCTSPSPVAGTPCPDAGLARVLMVGAANEVFVYYREGENIPLRMSGAKMIQDVRAP